MKGAEEMKEKEKKRKAQLSDHINTKRAPRPKQEE